MTIQQEVKSSATVPVFSNEVLCMRIRQGDTAAKEQLLLQNDGLIHTVAWRERRRYSYLTLELEDLWAAGQIGLLRAAYLFQESFGSQFVTYAWIHVRQAVQREIMNGGTTIRIPVHLHDRMHKIAVYREPFTATDYALLAKQITEAEPEGCGLSEKEVQEYLCQVEPLSLMRSLNEPMALEGCTERQELIADEHAESPEEVVGVRVLLECCLEQLNERERSLISMRYGLDGKPERTLEEIGRTLQISKERARQLERRAMEKMQNWYRLCEQREQHVLEQERVLTVKASF